jgi:hypothetical protein
MTTLFFTKEHTKGVLAGLFTNHTLTFVSVEAADKWMRAIRAKAAAGRLPFRLADASFQNFFRD